MKTINAAEKMELAQRNKVLSCKVLAGFTLLKDELWKMDYGLTTIFDCRSELAKLATSLKADLMELESNKRKSA
jgi:hypothetical protein